jgi:hypothetical protein
LSTPKDCLRRVRLRKTHPQARQEFQHLTEIGRVALLNAATERKLAREMEEWKHIDRIEEELLSILGKRPRSW